MSKRKGHAKRRRRMEATLEKLKDCRFHSLSPMGYVRVNVQYPMSFVLSNFGRHILTLFGHKVKMWSLRYGNFKAHGVECVRCGIRGQYFRLECHGLHANWENNSWHFNLYALNRDGDEVLMTKDHIIPKSIGGTSNIDNLQTMCCKCNGKKADSLYQ